MCRYLYPSFFCENSSVKTGSFEKLIYAENKEWKYENGVLLYHSASGDRIIYLDFDRALEKWIFIYENYARTEKYKNI